MADLYESKLDAVLKVIKALTIRTKTLGIFFIGIDTSSRAEISQPT